MPVLNAEYLHNTSDNHDKVYNVQVEQNGTRYHVVAEYGRRLGVLKRITKYSGSSQLDATLEFNKLVNEKVGKGYRRVGRGNAGTTSIGAERLVSNPPTPTSTASKKTATKAKPEPKEPDVYNPNFIPERRFDDL